MQSFVIKTHVGSFDTLVDFVPSARNNEHPGAIGVRFGPSR